MRITALIRALLLQWLGRLGHLMWWRTSLLLLLLLLLLGNRSKTRLTLTALIGHDSPKKVAWAMANSRRGRSCMSTSMTREAADAKV